MKNYTIKKSSEKNLNKKTLKQKLIKNKNTKNLNIKKYNNAMNGGTKSEKETKPKDYKNEYIESLNQLEFYNRVFEKHAIKAKKYKEAIEQIKTISDPLISCKQIKDLSGIGKAMIEKLDELIKTGKINNLVELKSKYGTEEYEKEKILQEKMAIFTQIPWIGDIKAKQLIDLNINTIEELKKRKDDKIVGKGKNKLTLLNSAQQKGLEYYEQILERIPRSEIDKYKTLLTNIFLETLEDNNKDAENNKFEIVGSYRRGKTESGDIDIIITSKQDDKTIFNKFLDKLDDKKKDATDKAKIIKAFLTRGEKKVMVIGKLSEKNIARRLDFLYSPPEEYAFAVLYFTGSKEFNTAMRQYALQQNLTLNEHGFHKMKDKVKGEKITTPIFNTEKDIFDYLNLEFKEPHERIDGNSIIIKPKEEDSSDCKRNCKEEDSSDCKRNCKEEDKPEKIKIKVPKTTKKTLKNYGKKDIYKNIEKFKNEGIITLKSLSEEELTEILKEAIDKYYGEKEEQILTDNEYDILREYVLDKYPDNKTAKEQHTELKVDKNKVKLPYEMWSMDKIKPDTNALKKFKQKFTGPYVLSHKLDGISILYTTEEKEPGLYTRGNGTYGESINHLIPYLNLPTNKNITLRGELIIKEKVFKEKYSKTYKMARNFITGIKNTKTLTKKEIDKIKDIDLVIYEVIKPENLKPSEQLKFLQTLKPNINIVEHIPNITQEQLTNEYLSEKLINWRENSEYGIDGIICIDDKIYPKTGKNPEHAFAFKMVLSDQVAEAKVIDVLWSASKDGFLKPRVQIEPVTIAGATISYATAFNAKFINDNKIGVGALIRIIRSGDVIPHIEEVITPADIPLMPKEKYTWNPTNVDIILTNKDQDKTVHLKNIARFFKAIEVDGLGEANIKKIIEVDGNTIPKILRMSATDFEEVENFKKKMATKVHNSIQKQIKKVSLAEVAAASNIFGRGFGEKRIQLILEQEPSILTEPTTPEKKIEKVKKIDGLAEKTATAFVKEIPHFLKFLEEANLEYKLDKDKDKDKDKDEHENEDKDNDKKVIKDHPLKSKNIVMSDFKSKTMTKKELTEKLKELGAKVESNITKSTDILIVGDITKETTKMKKAKEQSQIQIVELEEFLNDYFS